ncbi:MAG: archaetidylserine decarboxylase [Deltaproteobacteria bacterium]|nr:archaetidylserine decarboxylase [Deltaproteobacteria bacterium]
MSSPTEQAAARLLHLLPRERITRAIGKLTEARVPRPLLDNVLSVYRKAYNVNMDEAVVPEGGFETFNQFFTRELKQGARPIDPREDVLVSPADGRFDDAGALDLQTRFTIKNNPYDAASLLESDEDARAFAGGSFGIVYLSPRDYHRVHTPDALTVDRVRHIPGLLYPVNDFGVRHVPGLFARNERVVVFGTSPAFGRIAVVFVGAMVVGRIELVIDGPARPPIGGPTAERSLAPATQLARGDELGAFLLGSTVVLLVQPPSDGMTHEWDASLRGRSVRMGEALARRRRA